MANKAKSFLLFNRALKILWKEEPQLFISCFVDKVFSAIIPYVYIYISSMIIDELATSRSEQRLEYLLILMITVTLVLEIVGSLIKRWTSICADRFNMNKDNIFSEKMFSMSYDKIDSPHTQKVLSQIKQNERFAGFGFTKVVEIYENIIHTLTQIVVACILSYPMFFLDVPAKNSRYLFLNSPICMVVIFAILCGITILSPVLSNKVKKYWASLAQRATQANRLYSFYGFFAYDNKRALDIRIYNQNDLCRESFFSNNSFGGTGEIARYAKGYMGVMNALSVAVSYVFTGLVYLYVCIKAWMGAFSIGLASRYISAITLLLNGGAALVSVFGDILYNAPFLESIFDFLDEETNTLKEEKQEFLKEKDFEIEFQNVYFQYPNTEAWALKNINLKIKKGTSLVIVGENGSGKTTFIKLLCGLYKPTKGKIFFNGVDISTIDFEEYSSAVSTVFQDFNLLAFRINEAIACRRNFDISKVKRVTQCVDMHKRILQYNKTYNSYLTKKFSTDGVELSGGEYQRLAIARSLYKSVDIIVMDEPTASVDPIIENELLEKISEISKEKTSIFVSHRLSLCTVFDDIIVFKNGELVQEGTHHCLCENEDGEYFKLWNAQAKFYNT